MVQLAVKYPDPCTGASITQVRGGRGTSLAASDPVAARADSLQYQLNEGPCLGSARLDANYLLFDIAADTRLAPLQRRQNRTHPRGSVLCLQLEAEEAAALNHFADQPGVLRVRHPNADSAAADAANHSCISSSDILP